MVRWYDPKWRYVWEMVGFTLFWGTVLAVVSVVCIWMGW